MTCSAIQKKLSVFDELTTVELEHIKSCPECAAFFKDVKSLHITRKAKTPARIKSLTRKASLFELNAQPERPSGQSFFERLWQMPQTALTLTGFSVVALFITILYQINCDSSDIFCRISAVFIIIILVQNIIAALCVPLVVQHKNFLHYK